MEKIFPTEEDFMWNKNSPRSRLWYQMNNAPLWRISLEKIFPTEEDFMWNKNSPLSRLWYQIDNAPLWRILLEKIFPTEMDFMWNEKFPTVEDIVSKKFFATTEDLLLIPNKNLLQLNSDRVRCGEFFNSSNFLKKVPHDGCQARFYVCSLSITLKIKIILWMI